MQEGVKSHKEGTGEAENQQLTPRASENASLAGVTGILLAAFIHRESSSLPLSGKSKALNKVCYKGQ